MKKYFLFDLDGTVMDTGEGVMKCADYALEYFGVHGEPVENLRRFVGPPLHVSFQQFYGFSEEKAFQAVDKYRERYSEKGIYECEFYPGMKEMLLEFSKEHTLCIATSKAINYTEQILEMYGVSGCFSQVVGANIDGTMTDKPSIIREVMRRLGDPPADQVVMIGDRHYDITGAKEVGVGAVGVTYGYSVPGELQAAGADRLADTVEELYSVLLSLAE